MAGESRGKVPLLLLKTKSAPADGYEEYFSSPDNGKYAPVFVPVLEHRCKQDALDQVRRDILTGAFLPSSEGGLGKYGAIIFTSQRAVEAFAQVVEDIKREGTHPLDQLLPQSVPLYVVGPATARGLKALGLECPILGEETGTGEALAAFMLEHYNRLYTGSEKPALLFLVGDKRRDIIPKTLSSGSLGAGRCEVDELVVYETGEMLSFKGNFSSIWQANLGNGTPRQWVVVFSPTGCKAMLESLGLLDERSGKLRAENRPVGNVFVATIGPTTRDYLINEFGFSPDVCAGTPTPEGIAKGIEAFTRASSENVN